MKPTKTPLMAILLIFIGLVASCQQTAKQESTMSIIDKAELSQLLSDDPNVVLVDVRTSDEVDAGAIPGSINYDWLNKDAFKASVAELDKSKPIVVYCMSGTRSGQAAAFLAEAGFQKVYDYSEGYVGWQ